MAVNSGTAPAKVAAYVNKHRIGWPVIVDEDRQFERQMGMKEISLRNIYQVMFLTSDGEWREGRYSDIPGTVERALENASWKIDPAEIPASLRGAWRNIELNRFAEAAKEITGAEQSRDPALQQASQRLASVVNENMTRDAQKAWSLGKEEQYYQAHVAFQALEARFQGYQIPEKYTSAAKWVAKHPAVQRERKAAAELSRAQRLLLSPKTSLQKRGVDRLNVIVTRFAETEAAIEAEKVLQTRATVPGR